MKTRLAATGFALVFACAVLAGSANDSYLTWTSKQVESIGTNAYQRGRVGGIWDTRGLKIAELVVEIHEKEGHVEWPIPAAITGRREGS